MEFTRSVLALAEAGTKYNDMISYVKDSFLIDPRESRKNIEASSIGASIEPGKKIDHFNQVLMKTSRLEQEAPDIVTRLKALYMATASKEEKEEKEEEEEGEAVTDEAFDQTVQFLEMIVNSKLPLPEIDASSTGGIDLEWMNDKNATVCVSSRGTIVSRCMKEEMRGNVDDIFQFLLKKMKIK